MAHYAQLDANNIVTQVIVAEQDVINTGLFGDPSRWIQTSYNTHAGVHTLGGTPLRKNFAGIGYKYDIQRDAFIPPQPFPSWVLDENTCQWNSSVPYPNDGKFYFWDEGNMKWFHNENVVNNE